MDILAPTVSELAPSLITLVVMLTVIGGGIYLVLLLRRSARAQERIADTLVNGGRSMDDAGTE